MDEQEKKELLKTFDRFSGGRSLTAVYECESFSDKEQAVMLYFGHCALFQKDGYVNLKPHRLETVARKVRVSVDTARRAIKALIERGYLNRVRRKAANGLELTPEYSMTWKVFDEYEQKWLTKAIEKEKANDFGDSKVLPPPSKVLPQGLHLATPIILPLNSSPSSDSLPLSSLAGWKEEQPANLDKRIPKLVELSQQVEGVLKPKGYIDYDETNLFIAELIDSHGEETAKEWVEWLRRSLSGVKWKRGVPWKTKLIDSWQMYRGQEH